MPDRLHLTANEVLECLESTVEFNPWLANETDLGDPRRTPEFSQYLASALNKQLDEKAATGAT